MSLKCKQVPLLSYCPLHAAQMGCTLFRCTFLSNISSSMSEGVCWRNINSAGLLTTFDGICNSNSCEEGVRKVWGRWEEVHGCMSRLTLPVWEANHWAYERVGKGYACKERLLPPAVRGATGEQPIYPPWTLPCQLEVMFIQPPQRDRQLSRVQCKLNTNIIQLMAIDN